MEQTPGNKNTQKTILVVDDDAEVLTFVSNLLSFSNYNVLVAKDGREGLELAKKHHGDIHLLLTDFQMPEMSGVDLATKITQARPHIKILMMSGFTGGMLVLNEGWHFLAKPFIPSQLRALIIGLVSPSE